MLCIAPALSGEATDKADFKRLYTEFNDLYANSGDVDPLIKLGEKLYKLASKTYGKNSQNMAVATYNLASLYDEKGGETDSDEEKKAFKLYKKYFDILDKLKTIKDNTYLQQYQQYMFTYHNIKKGKANEKISGKLLNTAYGLNITNLELANIEFTVAIIRFKHKKNKISETLFNNALEKFTQEYGSENESVLHLQYWLAMVDLKNKKFDEAIPRLEKVAKFYFDNKLEQNTVLENSHQILHNIYFTKRNYILGETHSKKYHNLGYLPYGQNNDDSTFLPIVRVNP
ncbi:MAG: tetratricopeptide repeat protein [Emcibacteraceae bacterium]|nr:tetratricopeptide repeat protein [Emcibacteraceae bacterium]